MMDKNNIQPVFILSDDTHRTTGRSAQRNNILAARLVAETVRTTLGPKGMDKMLVDSAGEIIVTNDGVTILEEMHIAHPAAKMVVEVARTQENEIGDGTTTAVILAGELLTKAENLLDDKIHPTVIIKGYRLAEEKVLSELLSKAKSISIKDNDLLQKIAQTAMTGKGADIAKKILSELSVSAVLKVGLDDAKERIKITTKPGAKISDSKLIEGVVLDKEVVHPNMPTALNDAKVLLLDTPIEVKETETTARISISDPSQMQAFLDMEENMINRLVTRITSLGVNAVFCQKGVDDLASYQLARNNIMVVRRIKKSDMQLLSRATGAKVVSDLKDAKKEDLGFAGEIKQEIVSDEPMITISGCNNARAVTILLRAGTTHVLDELKRAVTDAVGDIVSALKSGSIVSGAGSIEMKLSNYLMKFSKTFKGREQLAIQAFAQALEAIPRTLAENAGLDPIDILADLRSAQYNAGVNVFTGKIEDAWNMGVIEPVNIKLQAISSATDVATMILRIDDVIASEPSPDGMGSGME